MAFVSRGRTRGFERLEGRVWSLVSRLVDEHFTGRVNLYMGDAQCFLEFMAGEPLICLCTRETGESIEGADCLRRLEEAECDRGGCIAELIELSKNEVYVDLDFCMEKSPHALVSMGSRAPEPSAPTPTPPSRGGSAESASLQERKTAALPSIDIDKMSLTLFDPLLYSSILIYLETIRRRIHLDPDVFRGLVEDTGSDEENLYILRVERSDGSVCRIAACLGSIVGAVLEVGEKEYYGHRAYREFVEAGIEGTATLFRIPLERLPENIKSLLGKT